MSSVPTLKLRVENLLKALEEYKSKEQAWEALKESMLEAYTEDVEGLEGQVEKVTAENKGVRVINSGLEADLFLMKSAHEDAVARIKELEGKRAEEKEEEEKKMDELHAGVVQHANNIIEETKQMMEDLKKGCEGPMQKKRKR